MKTEEIENQLRPNELKIIAFLSEMLHKYQEVKTLDNVSDLVCATADKILSIPSLPSGRKDEFTGKVIGEISYDPEKMEITTHPSSLPSGQSEGEIERTLVEFAEDMKNCVGDNMAIIDFAYKKLSLLFSSPKKEKEDKYTPEFVKWRDKYFEYKHVVYEYVARDGKEYSLNELYEKYERAMKESAFVKSDCPHCGKDLLETTSKQVYCICGYEK